MYEKLKEWLRPIWSVPFIYGIWDSEVLYAFRARLFKTREKLSGYQHEKTVFKARLGYELDLEHPKSLNQKIVWKEINDRNPLIPSTSDKYLARQFVKKALGEKEGSDILIPLLFVGDDPKTIPFENLPEEYIIKTNHASGQCIIVDKNRLLDKKEAITLLKRWLKHPYSLFEQEWGYWSVKRKIIIEPLLRDRSGDLAQDYKFHMFYGKCGFIHTTPKRNAERSGARGLFTPEWKLIDAGWKYPAHAYVDPPERLTDMLRIAEKLSAPFDYVRVDLYNPGEKIFFGELTHYHGDGHERFYPESFDFEFGKLWDIVPNYWVTKPHEA